MSTEIYINHPNFGLLYRVCVIGKNEELFTTLYAQRLFFKVTTNPQDSNIEPLTRAEARLLVEGRLRQLRGDGDWENYKQVNEIYQRTFQ